MPTPNADAGRVRHRIAARVPDGRPDTIWRVYLLVGVAAVVFYLTPLAGPIKPVLYDLIGASAVPAIFFGLRRYQPRVHLPWVLLALGQLFFVLGDAIHVYANLVLHRELGQPSVVDALWLSGYLLIVAALVLLLRSRDDGRDKVGTIDASIIATGFTLLVWTYVIAPAAADRSLSEAERVFAVLYPVLDLLLLAVTVRMAVRAASAAQRLLLLSMVTLFVADSLGGQSALSGAFVDEVVYPLWLVAYLTTGAAALHPSMRALSEPQEPTDDRPSGRRLWLLAACSLLAPLVLLAQWARGAPLDVPVLAGSAAVLFLLVVARVSLMARSMEALTERLAAQRGEQRFRSLVQNATDVIVVLDPAGIVIYETPSVSRVLGYAPGTLLGTRMADLAHPDDVHLLDLRDPGAQEPVLRQGRLRLADGSWAPVEVDVSDLSTDPAVGGLVLTIRDVRERHELERQLTHQAFHDPLTGLPNRQLFVDRLAQVLADADRSSCDTSLLFLDLDDFKSVNDTLGHDVGDQLLQSVAERLAATLGRGHTLCRLGGDEFAALLPATGPQDAEWAAQRLCAALGEPFDLLGRRLRVTGSVGVATRGDATRALTGADLLAAADTAMYSAKQAGRNRLAVFAAPMHEQLLRRVGLEQDLHRAVQAQQLTLAYQPVVALHGGRVVGLEALVRWTSPTCGPVSPVEFIPLAEQTGLIVPLGRHVLWTACAFVAECNRSLPADEALHVAVNVSVRQLREPDLMSDIQAALAAADLSPDLLTLEITESIRLYDGSAEVLNRLKTIGVRLSLDDFGTGYAALSHINELPIDELKIDRSFVSALTDSSHHVHLVAAILGLARALGLSVVAEGVETAEQARRLADLGCELAQGYLYSRPVSADTVRGLLTVRLGGLEVDSRTP